MMTKMFFAEIKQMISPNRIVSIKYEDKPLDSRVKKELQTIS